MTTISPAAWARWAAIASITPSCNQSAGSLQADAVIDDRGDMLGLPKDIDDIDAFTGRQHLWKMIEVGRGAQSFPVGDRRVHRHDAIAEPSQRGCDLIAGTAGIGGQADDRYRSRTPQQTRDLVGRWVRE